MDLDRQTFIKLRVRINADTDCWEWRLARTRTGYGKAASGKRGWITAHRASYMAFHGPIPDGGFICHKCDNPPCCNPDHLFLGTARDNSQDMAAKGRHGRWTKPERTARGERHGSKTKPWCVPRGEDAGQSLGTVEQTNRVLLLQMFGYHFKEIAQDVGLDVQLVRVMARGDHWTSRAGKEAFSRVGP